MSQTKLQNDVKNLLKMGFEENMAMFIAYANNGRVNEIVPCAEQIIDENQLIKQELKNCSFVNLQKK